MLQTKIGYFILWSAALSSISGCGVKGDPVPPGTPAEIGRGKPSYHESADVPIHRALPSPAKKTKDADDETND